MTEGSRELLAAEFESCGRIWEARKLRAGSEWNSDTKIALRAIDKARAAIVAWLLEQATLEEATNTEKGWHSADAWREAANAIRALADGEKSGG